MFHVFYTNESQTVKLLLESADQQQDPLHSHCAKSPCGENLLLCDSKHSDRCLLQTLEILQPPQLLFRQENSISRQKTQFLKYVL